MSTSTNQIASLTSTEWKGTNELWLGPESDRVLKSDGTLEIRAGSIAYTWAYDGQPKQGLIEFGEDSVSWKDSWHQPQPLNCARRPAYGALLKARGNYAAPPGPDWGWRILVSQRDTGELVLQMTNVAPWGEEMPAVRMVCVRA